MAFISTTISSRKCRTPSSGGRSTFKSWYRADILASAAWKKRTDGRYDVAVSVEAHKFYADGKGKEMETQMNEQVPIGAFQEEPGKKDFGKSKVLYPQNQRIVSGKRTIHVVTDRAPAFAGIDPYNEWIDRNSDDNVTATSAARS